MGSGPYPRRLQKGSASRSRRNEAYWRGAPSSSAHLSAVPDAATRIADLRTGKADVAAA